MENKLLLDADFCNMVANIENPKIQKEDFFKQLLTLLDKTPCIHEYVKNELLLNPMFNNLIQTEFIKTITIKDITGGESDIEQYYKDVFEEYRQFLYEDSKDKLIKYNRDKSKLTKDFKGNPLKDKLSGNNFGEIHSVIASQFLGIPILLSNDNGIKTLAKEKINLTSEELTIISGLDVLKNYKNQFDCYKEIRRAIVSQYPAWKKLL